MKYIYPTENTVLVNGLTYSIFKDLKFSGELPTGYTQRPYLRRHTKIDIYRDLMENKPEIYNKLREKYWFDAYQSDLEEKFFVPKEVKAHLEKDGTSPIEGNEQMNELLTTLSQSISTMGDKIEKLNKNSRLEEALLEGIIEKGKELATEDLRNSIESYLQEFVRNTYGTLPSKINLITKTCEYEKTGIYHKMFEKVLKLVNMNLPVMLTGGAGSGKNYMLEQVADALNYSFYYTSTITQEYKLTGFIDGGGHFHETEFYKAFTSGGVFMLDEIDASIPECLVILNGAIANGYFDFPTGREIAHENFRVVCAGNTVGLGADMVYTGRNVLDGATLDRFVLVEIEYDSRIESNLCQDEELRKFLYNIRESVEKNKINHIVGMRTFKYSYELLINEFDKKFIVESVILKGLQRDDINVIKNNLERDNGWYSYVK